MRRRGCGGAARPPRFQAAVAEPAAAVPAAAAAVAVAPSVPAAAAAVARAAAAPTAGRSLNSPVSLAQGDGGAVADVGGVFDVNGATFVGNSAGVRAALFCSRHFPSDFALTAANPQDDGGAVFESNVDATISFIGYTNVGYIIINLPLGGVSICPNGGDNGICYNGYSIKLGTTFAVSAGVFTATDGDSCNLGGAYSSTIAITCGKSAAITSAAQSGCAYVVAVTSPHGCNPSGSARLSAERASFTSNTAAVRASV